MSEPKKSSRQIETEEKTARRFVHTNREHPAMAWLFEEAVRRALREP